MKLKCENCYCDFEKLQEQKTCSRKCSDELKKKNNREKRICVFCKCEFQVKKTIKKTMCSDECRKNWAFIPENKSYRLQQSEKAVFEKYGVKSTLQLDKVKEKIKETKFKLYGDENFVNPKKGIQTKILKYGKALNVEKVKSKKKEKYGDENYNNRDKATKTMNELYGVDYAIQKDEFKEKQKQTNLEKYGTEYPSQNEEIKKKTKETIINKFGVDNLSQNKEIKQKKIQTSIKNFGVEYSIQSVEVREKGKKTKLKKYGDENFVNPKKASETNLNKYRVRHPMQLMEFFNKNKSSALRIRKYKETDLYYQGSYEKYFLELLEEKGFLLEVLNGQSFEYVLEEEKYIYHTDFLFRGQNIEIKSMWTYNNNGKNIKLQELNEVKWQSVRDKNEEIVVLIGKEEIKGFVKALK